MSDNMRKFKRYFTRDTSHLLTDLNPYCTICGSMKLANGTNDYGMPEKYICMNGLFMHHGTEKAGIEATREVPVIQRACPVCLWRNWHDAKFCGKCGQNLGYDR